MRRIPALLLAAGALVAPAPASAADPAALDPSFGDGGRVILGGPGRALAAEALAAPGDGSLVAAGLFGAGGDTGFVTARFGLDGRPDLAFGDRGVVRTDLGGDAAVMRLATLPDRRVLVAGYALRPGPFAAVARYLPDGRPDAAFGGSGVVRFARDGDRGSSPTGLVARPDGSAVVLGHDFSLTLLRADGSVDEGYGGPDVTPPGQGSAMTITLLGRREGGVVAVAAVGAGEGAATLVAAYDASGRLDGTFGDGGTVRLVGIDRADAAVAPDGAIVVAGRAVCDPATANANRCPAAVVARLLPDGRPDPAFGRGGRAVVTEGVPPRAVALDAEGRIALLGALPRARAVQVARLTAAGRPDTGFGGCGAAAPRLGVEEDVEGRAVVVQPSGRIVVAGFAGSRETGARLFLLALRGRGRRDVNGRPSLVVRPDLDTYEARRSMRFTVRSPERATLRSELLLRRRDARRLRLPRRLDAATVRLAPCRRRLVALAVPRRAARRLAARGRPATRLVLRSVASNAAGRRVTRHPVIFAR